MIDKDKPDFWREIQPGSTITLSDEQSIADSIERGAGVAGQDYLVESVWKIRQEDGLAEWLLFRLDDEETEVFLVVKMVDQNLDLMVLFEPDAFSAGNRRDIIDRGDTWIFREPENSDDFEFDELEFISEIIWTVEVEDDEGNVKEKEISYRMKGQGVLYGFCTRLPAPVGSGRMMAAVVEYATSEEFENQELMLLELGGEKSDAGGLISLLVGCRINLTEIDVLKSQPDVPVERKKPSVWEKLLMKVGS